MTYQINPSGEEQVTGFQMAGELLGMDAISTDLHHCTAVALEDSEVCEIPFGTLQQLLGDMPTLLRHFHRMMSQEITPEQSVMLLLGNMQATQRFARMPSLDGGSATDLRFGNLGAANFSTIDYAARAGTPCPAWLPKWTPPRTDLLDVLRSKPSRFKPSQRAGSAMRGLSDARPSAPQTIPTSPRNQNLERTNSTPNSSKAI